MYINFLRIDMSLRDVIRIKALTYPGNSIFTVSYKNRAATIYRLYSKVKMENGPPI